MPRIVSDITPLRRYPAFRRLWFGQLVSSTGSQFTVVAVAYQAYRISHSTWVVGLVSLAQLGPLLVGAMVGGSIADAQDRRRVLAIAQVCMALCSAALLANALIPHPALWPLFVATAAAAAFQATDNATRRAAITMIVPASDLTEAIAIQTVIMQWALVVGPASSGVIIAAVGLPAVYAIDVASFGASLAAVLSLPALSPSGGGTRAGVRSIVEGLKYLRGHRLLSSTFWIDLDAMIFGMPRAVFPALGTGLFHGGSGVVGLLYAAPGAGALAGSLLTGWVGKVRHQGRAVVVCVCVWGAAITAFGVVRILGVALVLLFLAGGADLVSAVFRQAVLQLSAPEHLQGRLSGVFFAVVAGGPRLGDAETGGAAALHGPQFAVWSGGLACLAGVAVLVWRVPELWRAEVPRQQTKSGSDQGIADATTELSP